MISQEQHMKIIENQRKIYEHITERPITMESQRQFCQHSKLLYFLAGTFGLSNFPSSTGKETRADF
jgi:hypothetical protein